MIISMPLHLAIFIWMKRAIPYGGFRRDPVAGIWGNGVQKYHHEFILPMSPNHDDSLDDFNKWNGEFSI